MNISGSLQIIKSKNIEFIENIESFSEFSEIKIESFYRMQNVIHQPFRL